MNETSTQLFLNTPSLAGGVKTVPPDCFALASGSTILIVRYSWRRIRCLVLTAASLSQTRLPMTSYWSSDRPSASGGRIGMATIGVPGEYRSPLPVAAPSRFFRRPGLPPLRFFFFFFPSSPLWSPPAPPLSSPASPPPRLFSELRPKAARSYLAIRCLRTSISAACSAIVRSSAAARSASACCDRISSISRSRDSPRSSAAAAGPAPRPRPP